MPADSIRPGADLQRRTVLVVASHCEVFLGLVQALLRFGYSIQTAYPLEAELDRAVRSNPDLAVVRPPSAGPDLQAFVEVIRTRVESKKIPILACVAAAAEEKFITDNLPSAKVLTGATLKLNELYGRVQDLLNLAARRELRITSELALAHREPGMYQEDFFYYDTILSLSQSGCFIKTDNPYAVGTTIEMIFFVGTPARKISATGRVCHQGEESGRSKRRGMGIQFEKLSPDDRAALDAFLLAQIGSSGMPARL